MRLFENLPPHYKDALDWEWSDFEPYAIDLLERTIDEDNILEWLQDWSDFNSLLSELYGRLYVATTVDTTDENADRQYKRYMREISEPARKVQAKLNRKFVESGIQPEHFGVVLAGTRAYLESYCDENVPLFTEISDLTLRYSKVIGAQTVEWDGEEKTLQQLQPVFLEQDRDRREQAWRLQMERQLADREKLNEIWSQFMGVRKQIYQNAGFKDFRAWTWKFLERLSYTPETVLQFCDAIEHVVVPASKRLRERKRQQLGYESLRPWDTSVDALKRPPLQPFQDVAELATKSQAIFNHIDSELGDYFQIMRDENLLDLDNRKGKAPGGYCATFMQSKRPFIFANAVGLQGDVRTMLHEAGHAFHSFAKAQLPYSHLRGTPMEFNEVASMAMELLSLPYLTETYGGYYTPAESARAQLEQLEMMLNGWAYMAIVVAFQHWIYTHHEEASNPDNCDEKWLELWARFTKGIDFSGVEHYIPNRWRQQGHIYRRPFYYVEYAMARLGAAQIWGNALQDQAKALADYKQALALGGTVSLPQLYETAGAKFAFDTETLGQAVNLIENRVAELRSA